MMLRAEKFVLLACLATLLTAEETRPKRDLQFLKEVIAAKLGLTPPPKPVQKEENVYILRIPNFNEVAVKEVPKLTVVEVPTPERIAQGNPITDIIGSYLGIRTQEESFLVQEAVTKLINMGVLIPKQEIIEVLPPKSPAFMLTSPVGQQRLEFLERRPFNPILKEIVVPAPAPVISQSLPIPYLQSVSVLPPPPERVVPAPTNIVVPEVKAVPILPPVSVPLPPPIVSVPVVPTSYSYRQIHTDGSFTSYLSEGNQDVIVTETNVPPPPPPAFIIDRLQKIIYGKSLGSSLSTPTVGNIVADPFYPEPSLPIILEPASVDVKVKHSDKNYTGTNTNTNHIVPTVMPDNTVTLRPIPVDVPATEVPSSEDDEKERYKHVHADSSVSTYTETLSPGGSYEIVNSKDISRLPPPPPELLHRIETVAGKAYNPRGYSLKMSNGVGMYENLNGGKIYYSRLENPDRYDALPYPLSSPDSNNPENPNKNVFVVGDGELDEYEKLFLSRKLKDEKNTDGQPNFQPIKKIPPLPMPIAGENQNFQRPSVQPTKYSYKIVSNPTNYHGFGTDGFSYTQVNHDGTVDTFTGTEELTKPFNYQDRIKKIHPLPAPISKVPIRIEYPPPTMVNVGKSHGYSYTQINNGGSVQTIAQDERVTVPAPVLAENTAPLYPVAVVDVLQSEHKSSCNKNKKCKKPVSSAFSYIQVENGGQVQKFTGDAQLIKPEFTETNQISEAPAAIVDVIQPYPRPQPVVVEVGDNSPGTVIFEKPAVSSYVYRQISHNNPQPFTVVKVEDEPTIKVPVADVHVKVNPHKHIRPDGTGYVLCTEFHKVAPDAEIPPLPSDKVIATVPNDLIYVPPPDVYVPSPISDSGSQFTYTQLSSGTAAKDSTSTTEDSKQEDIAETTSGDKPLSFELNPIVVAPEDTKYSYAQKNPDGSSIKVEGDKDNTVSVTLDDSAVRTTDAETVENSEIQTSQSARGDIPATN